MKKQFFYAALAIGMMSSCTSSDLPGNQAPEEQLPEEERVAIELGIQAPGSSITASTKSTGAVGGMTDETNLWKGQPLYVVAYDKGTSNFVIDSETITESNPGGDYIFKDLTFSAPTQANIGDDAKIKIFNSESNIKAVYYNPTGNMDFYGYHIDDAGDGTSTGILDGFTVKDLTITGAQDLLGARTKAVTTENYPTPVEEDDINAFNGDDPVRGFSAWAARRKIQPILDFKHLLTRFTFTVEAAEKTAAEWYWDNVQSDFVQNKNDEDESTAVQITKIIIKDVKTDVDIVLYEDGQDLPYVKVKDDSDLANLELKGRDNSGASEDLIATAAMVFDDSNTSDQEQHKTAHWEDAYGSYSLKTPVGESLMIPAGNTSITIQVELSQRVVDTENPTTGDALTWKTKKGTVETTLDFDNVTNSQVSGATSFAAGASYAVNIRVFSFQRIEITAALSKWNNGGDLNVDAE